jgi:hypothetical protein
MPGGGFAVALAFGGTGCAVSPALGAHACGTWLKSSTSASCGHTPHIAPACVVGAQDARTKAAAVQASEEQVARLEHMLRDSQVATDRQTAGLWDVHLRMQHAQAAAPVCVCGWGGGDRNPCQLIDRNRRQLPPPPRQEVCRL